MWHDCESALPEDREQQPDGIHPGTEVFRSPRSPDCSTLPKSSPSHTSQHGHYPVAQKIPVPSAAGCSCRRLFFLDDDLLALRAPAVAGKGAITSDHAMTRGSPGQLRWPRRRVRDSTDRAWFANAGSERGVSNLVADPNPEQCGPDAPLEGCSSNIERQIEPLYWGCDKRQNLFEIGA